MVDQRRSPPWPEASPSAAGTPQRHDRRSVSLLPVTLVLVLVLRTRSWLLYVLVVVLFEVSRAVIVLHLYYVVYTDVGIEAHRNDTMVLVLVLEKVLENVQSCCALLFAFCFDVIVSLPAGLPAGFPATSSYRFTYGLKI